ncbi:MAG: PRD domain-containing protein [Eubacteriaceae bacterium]|nr:PRD domain-containing protein [Eubacteriaceae bacterium]
MESYKVLKVFNNNSVLVDKEGIEYILMGKGIGFDKKKGMSFKEEDIIENVFISVNETNKRQYENLMNEVEEKIFISVVDIIALAEGELGEKLHPDTHFGLIDHVNFAIKRIREGIMIVNPFILETKMLYRKEYAIAQKGVELLNQRLRMDIPESEIGFIALHIHGGRLKTPKNSSLKYIKAISNIIPYIEDKLGVHIQEDSFSGVRLIAHLRGVIERCAKEIPIENIFLDRLKSDYPFEYKISENIGLILEKNIGIIVPESEVGYIALHIYKLNKTT